MGIKTDGTAWVWGGNYYGALGHNSVHPAGSVSSPIQLTGDWTKLLTDGGRAMAIRNA